MSDTLRPTVSQQCLTSEGGVVLKEVVDVANPVVLFPRMHAFALPGLLVVLVSDRGPIYAGDWVG